MIIIAHRGNLSGPSDNENSPNAIDKAISLGYDVEVDVHVDNNTFALGHDKGDYVIDISWLEARKSKLWIHCKNFDAVEFFSKTNFNFFYHINDPYTLTNSGHVWAYPGYKIGENFILVMPESVGISPSKEVKCFGVCTDFSHDWKNR